MHPAWSAITEVPVKRALRSLLHEGLRDRARSWGRSAAHRRPDAFVRTSMDFETQAGTRTFTPAPSCWDKVVELEAPTLILTAWKKKEWFRPR